MNRRDFLSAALSAAAAARLARGHNPAPPAAPPAPPTAPPPLTGPDGALITPADKPLRILFLGGTVFLGPHTVAHALARGHTVTLFNRGKSNPDLFPALEKLRGNRRPGENNDLAALRKEVAAGRTWDAVIDTSAYYPRSMRDTTTILKDSVGHYAMVASVNVYSDEKAPNQDESAPTWDKWPDEGPLSETAYGPMKRGCEVELDKLLPMREGGRSASVRPALICGPRDPSDRFTYWPVRCKRAVTASAGGAGSEILAPVGPDEPVQLIDVRDLATFLVRIVERKLTGPYNAVGPGNLKLGATLDACLAAARASAPSPATATFTWATYQFLKDQKVESWSDLPVWIPTQDPEQAGSNLRIGRRAVEAGFTCRPLRALAEGTLAWWESLPESRRAQPRSGLTAQREAEVLGLLRTARP